MSRLVVVSNRIALPDDKKSSAGGLAVGILGALRAAVREIGAEDICQRNAGRI